MNGHGTMQERQTEEPMTYTKSILLRDDGSPTSRRTGSMDSYATSEGTSYDGSPTNEPSTLSPICEDPIKRSENGLGLNGGDKGGESTVRVTSSPSSEADGEAATPQQNGAEAQSTQEPTSTLAKPLTDSLASRMATAGGALAPAANGPPTPPPLIIPNAMSLPNSPDPNRLPTIQARRQTNPVSTQPSDNTPVSPLSGRRGFQRPMIGAMPSSSSMRITPAVLLTPAVSRPLTLFPLPPMTPAVGNEDAEQEARRAKRAVPVLMSPGAQEYPDEDAGGSSSPGTSDDEGDDSEGTSEEGTSTEDARSTRSSSGGSSNVALSESPGTSRERMESGATSSSSSTLRRPSASSERPMTSFGAAMAPFTRPFLQESSPDSDEHQIPEGTPTPGPSKASKAKERDYFSSKSISPTGNERSPLQTPRPKTTGRPRGVTDADARARPSLYHQKSRSLVDLTADTRKPSVPESAPKPQTIPENEVLKPKPVPALKRRTSLPSTNPPPYSPPHPAATMARTTAREEEGKEKLPPYSCGVHIEGTLQRKMEFSAPGVQARDRSWKKYWFELHGPSLKVFRHDLRKVPVKGYAAWDGKGCAEDGKARHVHLPEGILEDRDRALRLEREKSRIIEEQRKAAARRASVSSSTTENRRMSTTSASSHTSRSTSLASSPPPSFHSSRTSVNASAASISTSPSTNGTHETSPPPSPERPGPSPFEKLSPPPTGVAVPALRDKETRAVATSASSSSLRHPHLPSFHHGNAMLRHYTMQGAESGLGADYKKRKNVIRVRAEGEQFLLQADTLVDVVNWIEAFQAATNIALDLDERPMPKLPTLPRRRRRRRPPQDGAAAAAGTANAAHPISPGTATGSASNPPHSAASTSRS